MVLPEAFIGRVDNLHYYQGVIIAEVAVTLVLYIILRIVHYVKWGHAEENQVQKKPEGEEQATTRKWDQKVWDIYFPIIYTNHLACLTLTLCFIPYIFGAILAYIHFAVFCGMIIVDIFIKDAQPGNGNRTKVTRILWIVMCVTNIIQIVCGLTGVAKVL